uniref:Uncharacterized protein LOC111122104 n=1 Tax=Crassostrea virginica TaxID=6565 RepID=A0A8B8CUL8_CRAVI|nr:uncharacterized protein LOC111122104 [Crassostrea virginica]
MSSRSGDMGRSIIVCFLVIRLCSSEYCSYKKGRTVLNKGSCTQLEHCVSHFDPQTGQCPHNQCKPGWMGPGCQYVNLAINDLNNHPVFDGSMSTHHRIRAAMVNFKGTFIISAIKIHLQQHRDLYRAIPTVPWDLGICVSFKGSPHHRHLSLPARDT